MLEHRLSSKPYLLLLPLALSLATACGEDPVKEKVLEKLNLSAETTTAVWGQEIPLTVTGVYDDQSESDLSAQATLTLADPEAAAKIATLLKESTEAGWKIRGIQAGDVTVQAEMNGIQTTLDFHVVPQLVVEMTPDSEVIQDEITTLKALVKNSAKDGDVVDVTKDTTFTVTSTSAEIVKGHFIIAKAKDKLEITATYNQAKTVLTKPISDCIYPASQGKVLTSFGTLPPLVWKDALDENGKVHEVSLRDLHCKAQRGQAEYDTLIFYMTARWCGPCHELLARQDYQAKVLTQFGKKNLTFYLSLMSGQYDPIPMSYDAQTSKLAAQDLNPHLGKTPGLRAGGVSVEDPYKHVLDMQRGLVIADSIPHWFVVRARDMAIIYDGLEVDPTIMVKKPEINYGADGADSNYTKPFEPKCAEGDEEASEPNNAPELAQVLSKNQAIRQAALCERRGDFYRIDVPEGTKWQLETSSPGLTLNLLGYNKNGSLEIGTHTIQTSRGPAEVPMESRGKYGSASLDGEGPVLIRVYSPNGGTGKYELFFNKR